MTSRNERVFTLLKEQGKKKADMARALNISKSAITQWEKKGVEPSYEQCIVLSKFFDIPVEYLYNGEAPKKEWQPTITDKDEKDIKKAIDAIKNQLSTGTGLMYDGEPMDEESMEAVLAAIEVAERTAVLAAKKKFTPNKYRK